MRMERMVNGEAKKEKQRKAGCKATVSVVLVSYKHRVLWIS